MNKNISINNYKNISVTKYNSDTDTDEMSPIITNQMQNNNIIMSQINNNDINDLPLSQLDFLSQANLEIDINQSQSRKIKNNDIKPIIEPKITLSYDDFIKKLKSCGNNINEYNIDKLFIANDIFNFFKELENKKILEINIHTKRKHELVIKLIYRLNYYIL